MQTLSRGPRRPTLLTLCLVPPTPQAERFTADRPAAAHARCAQYECGPERRHEQIPRGLAASHVVVAALVRPWHSQQSWLAVFYPSAPQVRSVRCVWVGQTRGVEELDTATSHALMLSNLVAV